MEVLAVPTMPQMGYVLVMRKVARQLVGPSLACANRMKRRCK